MENDWVITFSGKIVRENDCDKEWHDNLKQDNTSALGFIFHPAFRGLFSQNC